MRTTDCDLLLSLFLLILQFAILSCFSNFQNKNSYNSHELVIDSLNRNPDTLFTLTIKSEILNEDMSIYAQLPKESLLTENEMHLYYDQISNQWGYSVIPPGKVFINVAYNIWTSGKSKEILSFYERALPVEKSKHVPSTGNLKGFNEVIESLKESVADSINWIKRYEEVSYNFKFWINDF